MDNILTNSETLIMRKVRDIDHMMLCDGFQYGIITYRKGEQLVRRARSMETWRFVTNLESTIKADIEAEQDMQALDTAVDLDEQLEVNAQRQIDSQADQNYYAQCASEGYDPRGHDRNCDCSECSGDKPVPGWPPTAQETVCYQQVMAKPDEF